MQERVYHDRNFDIVDQLKQATVLDAHRHGASLITALDNGNVICSVSWIRMADILTITVYTVKLLLLPMLC